MAVKSKIKEWKRYYTISDVGQISRRYFVMNAFDGALTMLGVVIGAYVAKILLPITIITAALSGSIAMGISGISGAYMTEKAERTKELKELERAMVTDLKHGVHHRSSQFATIFAALVDGLSPALSAMFVVSPFFLAFSNMISVQTAFYACIALTLVLLTILGIYLAKISEESMVKYGIKMLIVGMITAFLCVLTSILIGGNGIV